MSNVETTSLSVQLVFWFIITVIPCLIFISRGWYLLPSFIVLLVDFGDFLDSVAARYWIDVLKERQEALDKKEDKKMPGSPAASDASFGTCYFLMQLSKSYSPDFCWCFILALQSNNQNLTCLFSTSS